MIKQRLGSPGSRLLGATFFAFMLALLVIWISTSRPWYGMSLVGFDGQVQLRALDAEIELKHAPVLPATVHTIGHRDKRLWLNANDVIEEPDVFDDFAHLDEFRLRQQMLSEQMQHGELSLLLTDAQGQQQLITLPAQSSRPLASLPIPFWVQLVTGIGGFIIGIWVLVLRPRDAAARSFMLSGVSLMMAALAAAIYSTRELAISADLMRNLMWLNHAGSVGFGFSLMSLFLYFPQRLASTAWLWIIVACYGVWLILELFALAAAPQTLIYVPVLILSSLIVLLIIWQRRSSRGKPQALAALRWMGLVTIITIGCFIVLAALPALLNTEPVVSQGNAFGFFLILYAGFALGLKRYRLFDLDRWAYYVLVWVLAGVVLVSLDLLLLTVLHWQQQTSLLASLLLCGFIYLPLRSWLWQRLVERPKPDSRSLFNHIVEIALAPNKQSYIERWQALLDELFKPLHIQVNADVEALALSRDGQSLNIPSMLHSPALTLVLAEKGRRLFVPEDIKLAAEVIDMLSYVNDNRQAYQSGARQERLRIAQDLHDDLGSRLLTGLHQPQLADVRDTISMALAEMRSIVRGLAGQALPLDQLLAELREECFVRCEGADIELTWPVLETHTALLLNYHSYRHLLSIIRELFSNIIRHSGADHAEMIMQLEGQQLRCTLRDNGRGFDGVGSGGNGLSNLQGRVQQLNGNLHYEPQQQGTLVHLEVSLSASGHGESTA